MTSGSRNNNRFIWKFMILLLVLGTWEQGSHPVGDHVWCQLGVILQSSSSASSSIAPTVHSNFIESKAI